MPNVGLGDVLIRVRASGICGSDLHAYWRGRIEGLSGPHGSGQIMGGTSSRLIGPGRRMRLNFAQTSQSRCSSSRSIANDSRQAD